MPRQTNGLRILNGRARKGQVAGGGAHFGAAMHARRAVHIEALTDGLGLAGDKKRGNIVCTRCRVDCFSPSMGRGNARHVRSRVFKFGGTGFFFRICSRVRNSLLFRGVNGWSRFLSGRC